MKKEINVGLHNHFDIVVRDAKTQKMVCEKRAYNIILDSFWSEFLQSDPDAKECLDNIYFGSGTTAPVATDTSLTTYGGGKATANKNWDYSEFTSDGTIKITGNIRLEASEYVGTTISEVGFGRTSTFGLCTKSLIKDQNGNAISITKLVDQVVDIFGTFYVKLPMTGEVRFTGIGSPAESLVARLTFRSYSSSLLILYRNLRIDEADGFSLPYKSYQCGTSMSFDVPNRKLTINIADLTAASGNIGGLKTLIFQEGPANATVVAELPGTNFTQPEIVKEAVGNGDGSNTKFACDFGNIKDNGTAKLYVDDVEVPATFVYGIGALDLTDMVAALKVVSYDRSLPEVPTILENLCNDTLAVKSTTGQYYILYSSDDGVTWTVIRTHSSGSIYSDTVALDQQNKRFYKLTNYGSYDRRCTNMTGSGSIYHAIAASAPADGAAVTMTYTPEAIAKDAEHVVKNVKIELAFNEYTPA